MITALRALFVVVLASMIWVTTWAGLQCPLFAVPAPVATHPWFVAIMALGNIAMSSYCLAELSQVPREGKLSDVLVARRQGPGWLGAALALAGVAVTIAAALASRPAR